MGLSRAPKGCPPVLHQPGSDQLSACLKRKPKQMHSRTTSILAITENRGEGFDAVQRAPHAKSIRLPCDRCRSRSDTNRSQEQINASHPGPQQIHTAARTPCMRTSLVRTKTFVLSLAPHAKSIRLPCDRYSHLRVPSSKFTVHSTSDTLREVVFVHFDFVSIYIQKQSDITGQKGF